MKYMMRKTVGGIRPYAKESDAGLDLLSAESTVLTPFIPTKIPTGVSVEIPTGFVGLIWDKSSVGSLGIKVLGGVIDSGYRGEIIVVLINLTTTPIFIQADQKIAQLIIQPYATVALEKSEYLSETSRGDGGFGSTGLVRGSA